LQEKCRFLQCGDNMWDVGRQGAEGIEHGEKDREG